LDGVDRFRSSTHAKIKVANPSATAIETATAHNKPKAQEIRRGVSRSSHLEKIWPAKLSRGSPAMAVTCTARGRDFATAESVSGQITTGLDGSIMPRYNDLAIGELADTFILSGAEDLVPLLRRDQNEDA
jgi:hypothetical protein